MQQQMASVLLPNTKIYMVAPMHAIDYAGLSTEPVKLYYNAQGSNSLHNFFESNFHAFNSKSMGVQAFYIMTAT